MTPYEILLSESQERMLVIGKIGKDAEIKRICAKWQLDCEQIGEVIPGGRFIVDHEGVRKADIPAAALSLGGQTPQYKRAEKRPEYLDELNAFDPLSLPVPKDFNDAMRKMVAAPNLADKTWVYRQYDQSVRTGTAMGPGMDAGVIRIRKTNTALAATTDCNGRYCYLNPRLGAQIAVAEAARNLVCVGAKPLAITNCLNFGNPYKAEMYYQFAECVRGMGVACRFFGTPVTGGNVSFYNEDPTRAVFPTPTIGMIGKIENLDLITTGHFKEPDDGVALIGTTLEELGGSEYLKLMHGRVAGHAPALDFDLELKVQQFVMRAIRSGWICAAHDCSDGGLAVALFEMCIGPDDRLKGFDGDLSFSSIRPDALLFSESQSRIVISFAMEDRAAIEAAARADGVRFQFLGHVTASDRFVLRPFVDESVNMLRELHREALPSILEEVTAVAVA
jgi:phosphoribosylformylglycinamidine synthase